MQTLVDLLVVLGLGAFLLIVTIGPVMVLLSVATKRMAKAEAEKTTTATTTEVKAGVDR